MFGETYFANRQALLDIVSDVAQLASDTGADPGELRHREKLLTGLTTPFLFVVCGEVNAGKSTLLNGLFGRDLCKTNVLPETDRVQWFRYGRTENRQVTGILEECFREIDFLMDFNLVDTPGTNSVVRGHQKITERFLPVADLLLFVFPVSNPWGAATWDFLGKLSPEIIDKVVLVVQQADLRDDRDINVILGHMRELAQQRLGRIPPIFSVSAKMALEAKQSMPFSQRQWEESGYTGLEKFISDQVAATPERRRVLERIRATTASSLQRIEHSLEQQTSGIDRKTHFIAELEDSIDALRTLHTSDMSQHGLVLTEAFSDVSSAAVDELRSALGPARSLKALFSGDRLPAEIEAHLEAGVGAAVENRAHADGNRIIKECEKHWASLEPEIQKNLGMAQPDFFEGTAGFAGTKARFVRRMSRGAIKTLKGLKLRSSLDLMIGRRQNQLKLYVLGLLSLVTLGGVLGAAGITFIASLVCFAVASGVAALMFRYLNKSREEIVVGFREKCTTAKRNFPTEMESDYKDGVRQMMAEYGSLLDEIRRAVGKQKQSIAPALERWNHLFLRLKSLEQEL